jgi:hypothetical protein
MAKMKSFMVEVEITYRTCVMVDARKPGGAVEKLQTDDGWHDAFRYHEDVDLRFQQDGHKIVNVREVGS